MLDPDRTRTGPWTRSLTQDPEPNPGAGPRASHCFSSPHCVALVPAHFPRWSHVFQGAFSGFFPSAASVAASLLPPLPAGPPSSLPGSATNICGSGLFRKTRSPEKREGGTRLRSFVRPAASPARLRGKARTGRTWSIFHGLFFSSGSPGRLDVHVFGCCGSGSGEESVPSWGTCQLAVAEPSRTSS